jgi:hypothetical protein
VSGRGRGGRPRRRDRALQVGFVVVAIALVAVADAIAIRAVEADPGALARGLHALLLVGGRVVAGWSVGLVFRLQLAPVATVDTDLRRLLGLPLAVVCGWPILLALLPPGVIGFVPTWLRAGPAIEIQQLTAVVLGLVLALGVRRRGR